MSPHADLNWWDFAIDSTERNNGDATFRGDGEVNPEIPDGLRFLDYHKYIGLDKLLDCQVPSSRIPDERIFIITHQLFELVFKQMIFDFAVLARTFEALLSKDDPVLKSLCKQSVLDIKAAKNPNEEQKEAEDFWRPALHASGRLKYSSQDILPALLKYLDPSTGSKTHRIELFSRNEFMKFRDNLIPASGFQTAQFRLIARALGKSNLLKVRLFPSLKHQTFYVGKGKGDNLPVSLADQLILRNGYIIANPPQGSTWATVAQADRLAHDVLCRLSAFYTDSHGETDRLNLISSDDNSIVEAYDKTFRSIQELERQSGSPNNISKDERIRVKAKAEFEKTWKAAVVSENERRKSLETARKGARFCRSSPRSYLSKVLDRIVETDREMHGYHDTKGRGFLSKHLGTVGRQIGRQESVEAGGTAGGGTPYLSFSMDNLFHKFPALVHYEDLVPAKSKRQRIVK